ncbi:MAG: DnaJ domain-containing protein [Myxococcota bacterium]
MEVQRDPYAILHVGREATDQEIRAAYRKLMLQQPITTTRLMELRAAYELLMDATRRAAYDEEHTTLPDAGEAEGEAFLPPYALDPAFGGRVRRPMDLMGSVMKASHLLYGVPEPPPREGNAPLISPADVASGEVDVQLMLGPREAREGGEVVVMLPVQTTCALCRGEPAPEAYCAGCENTGKYTHEQPMKVLIPPGVKDGTVSTLVLDVAGLQGLVLRLTVHVQDA